MRDTGPGEIGRVEAQRIADATANALQHRDAVDNERAFRERVLVTLERLEVKQDNMSDVLDEHCKDDEYRFGNITQTVNESKGTLNKFLGAVAVLVALGGFLMWFADRMKP